MKSVWWLGLAASELILSVGQVWPMMHPVLSHAHMQTSTTVVHDGYEYRTLMPGVIADGTVPNCHQPGRWLALPGAGWELAPDSPEIRRSVVAAHSWSARVVVLASMKGIMTKIGHFPGTEFGNMQPKAKMRYMNGVKEWTCPWTCYQILIRLRLQDGSDVPEHLLPVHRGKTIGDFLKKNPAIVEKFGKKALQLLGQLDRPAHENDYQHPDEEPDEEDDELDQGEETSQGLPTLPWAIAIGATCLAVATVCLSCGVCLGARWFSRSSAMPAQPLLQASGRDLVPMPGATAATAGTGLTSYQEMEA